MLLQQIKRAQSLFLTIMLIAVFAFATLAAAQPITNEVMFLTGVIKSIDNKKRLVVVEVVNKGCKGVKTFSIDDLSLLRAVVGDEISFYSDSVYCPGPMGHKMFPQGDGRKR